MTGQDSHQTRLVNGHKAVDEYDPWKVIHRALNRMVGTSSARALLNVLAHTALRLTDADLAQVDLYVPASECFVLGGLAGKDDTPSPLCSHPHQNALALAVLKQGQPLYRDLAPNSGGFVETIHHVLLCPLLETSLRGVILIGYEQTPMHPHLRTAEMLGVLAAQAALILYQLGERREWSRKSSHLALINKVSRLVAKSIDRLPPLDRILGEIYNTFDLCGVLLYTGEPPLLSAARSKAQVPLGVHLDEGLARRALEGGQSLMSPHVGQDDRCVMPAWLEVDVQSEAAIPLIDRGEVVGVLSCLRSGDRAFDGVDLQTLTVVGGQIVTLIREIAHRDHKPIPETEAPSPLPSVVGYGDVDEVRMTSLAEVDSLSLAGASLDEMVAGPVLDAALRVLEADGAALYLFQARQLVPDGYHAARRRFDWTSVESLALARETMQRDQPLISGAITGIPWPPSTQEWRGSGGAVAAPVSWQGKLYAVLLVAYRGVVNFPEVRARAIQDLVRLTALALTLAARCRNGVQQARQWRFLYEIALKTQRLSSPMEGILEAADRLCETMEWQQAEVYRWDATSGGFVRLGDLSPQPFVMPETQGIVGEAARRQEAVIRNPPDVRSGEMAVPLMEGERLRGVFYVQGRIDQRFGEDDRRFLSDVAAMMTDTLTDVALYGRLRHQLRETQTLYDITRQVNYKADLDEVLPRMLDVIQTVIESQRTTIALVDDSGERLQVTWTSKLAAGQQDDPVTIPVGQGVLGRVAATGKPAHVTDLQKRGARAVPFETEEGRALLAVPLVSSQGETIGTLSVSSQEPGAFTRAEAQILTVAAGQIAMVIENMKLYQGLAQRGKRLKAAYQQLREFAKLKDQILQNISHELRTPLTLIKGHVELVLEDPDDQLAQAQRRGLEMAMVKSDEVVNIVEKIVSLSPLSSFALRHTSIPVRPLLESMARTVAKRVRDRPIRIRVEYVEPDLCLYGDFDKIKQVCYNILDNSIKFSPRGGDILMSASSEGTYVHLQFEDHGVGIPQQRISRIFDTFYQVDGSSTRQFGGLGLGLTVVHRIVEAHHGKIWAESEEGRGSIFHVLLPRDAEKS